MPWDRSPALHIDTVEKSLLKKHNRIVLDCHRRIVFRAPVDTGLLRGATTISNGTPSNRVPITPSASAAQDISRGYQELARSGGYPYKVTYLTNNLPYAQKIEEGTSDQARNGFWAVSYNEIRVKYTL